jgi:hypothetical protein
LEIVTLQTIIDLWSDIEIWAGYVWAVSIGILTFAVLTLAAAFVTGAGQAHIAGMGPPTFVLLWCVFCIFYWTMGILTALPAVTLMLYGAKRLGLQNAWYYGVTGALTGIYITPLYVAIDLPLYWITTLNPTFWQRFWAHLPWGVSGCFAAGLTLWWRAKRTLRARH